MDSGGSDGAQDGDRLAAELGQGDSYVGVNQDFFEAKGDGGFELVGSESGGLELADDGKIDVTAAIDGDGFAVDLVDSDGADQDLVARTQGVVVVNGWDDRTRDVWGWGDGSCSDRRWDDGSLEEEEQG